MEVMKRCTICREEKLRTSEYFRRATKSPDGLQARCKKCADIRLPKLPSPNEGYKRCSKCGEEKPATKEYFYCNHNRRDQLESCCKWCRGRKRPYLPVCPEGYRYCTKCSQLYPSTEKYFFRTNQRQDGLETRCKACVSRKNKERFQINGDKVRASNRISYQKHHQLYRMNNYERVRKREKTHEQNRRARKRNASGIFTAIDINLQIKNQTDRKGKLCCWWCNKPIQGTYHIDHRIPLVRGGSNAPDNLVISCPHCNLSKNSKMAWEWNGRLL